MARDGEKSDPRLPSRRGEKREDALYGTGKSTPVASESDSQTLSRPSTERAVPDAFRYCTCGRCIVRGRVSIQTSAPHAARLTYVLFYSGILKRRQPQHGPRCCGEKAAVFYAHVAASLIIFVHSCPRNFLSRPRH